MSASWRQTVFKRNISLVSRPAASASPEMMLEMQILEPHPSIRNSGAAQESVILIACWNWRTAVPNCLWFCWDWHWVIINQISLEGTLLSGHTLGFRKLTCQCCMDENTNAFHFEGLKTQYRWVLFLTYIAPVMPGNPCWPSGNPWLPLSKKKSIHSVLGHWKPCLTCNPWPFHIYPQWNVLQKWCQRLPFVFKLI